MSLNCCNFLKSGKKRDNLSLTHKTRYSTVISRRDESFELPVTLPQDLIIEFILLRYCLTLWLNPVLIQVRISTSLLRVFCLQAIKNYTEHNCQWEMWNNEAKHATEWAKKHQRLFFLHECACLCTLSCGCHWRVDTGSICKSHSNTPDSGTHDRITAC